MPNTQRLSCPLRCRHYWFCPLPKHFLDRLYNYEGTQQPDPNIDPRLLKSHKMSCPPFGGISDIIAPFDITTLLFLTMNIMGIYQRLNWVCRVLIMLCFWTQEQGLWFKIWQNKNKFFQLLLRWINQIFIELFQLNQT